LSVVIQLIPNHVKQEVNGTVTLPPLVFPVCNIKLDWKGLPGKNIQAYLTEEENISMISSPVRRCRRWPWWLRWLTSSGRQFRRQPDRGKPTKRRCTSI